MQQKGEVMTYLEAVTESEHFANLAVDETKIRGDLQRAQAYAMLAQYYLDQARLIFEMQKAGAL
jgi:hypothetical protein